MLQRAGGGTDNATSMARKDVKKNNEIIQSRRLMTRRMKVNEEDEHQDKKVSEDEEDGDDNVKEDGEGDDEENDDAEEDKYDGVIVNGEDKEVQDVNVKDGYEEEEEGSEQDGPENIFEITTTCPPYEVMKKVMMVMMATV